MTTPAEQPIAPPQSAPGGGMTFKQACVFFDERKRQAREEERRQEAIAWLDKQDLREQLKRIRRDPVLRRTHSHRIAAAATWLRDHAPKRRPLKMSLAEMKRLAGKTD